MVEVVESGSPIQIFFNLVFFLFLLYVAYNNYKNERTKQELLIVLGVLLFCIYSFWGADYFHYKEIFDTYQQTAGSSHLETVYSFILLHSPSYFVYRLVVWGSSFFLLWKASKRIDNDSFVFLFFFIALYLLRFSYARASLAISMMMYGYTLIIKPGSNRIASTVVGVIIALLSLFFHKSAVIIILSLPLSFLSLSRRNIIIALIALPVLVFFLSGTLYDYILGNELISNENTLNAFNLYTQNAGSAGRRMGLGELVQTYGEMIPIYLFLILGIKAFYYDRESSVGEQSVADHLLRFVFWSVLIATFFAFITPIIHIRMLYLAYAPLVLFLSSSKALFKNKSFRRVLGLGIFIQLYLLMYSLHCAMS